MKGVLVPLLLIITHFLFAQETTKRGFGLVSGLIEQAETHEPVIGAIVQLDSIYVLESDLEGVFKFDSIVFGRHHLKVKSENHSIVDTLIELNANLQYLKLQLKELDRHITKLEDVILNDKSEAQTVKDQAIKAEVIDTKKIQQEASTLTELINRSSGVKVRQQGGLGSGANISINGYQGKAIKFFKDGIPLDYFGEGFNISLVPLNMLDRIEIYKGVLPVKFGADALGGAVNMVSKYSFKKYVDFSYEIASFNTHRASINSFYRNTTHKIFLGADAFYNYSDNNYKVTVKVVDPVTRNRKDQDVNRFHDNFKNLYTEVYGGLMQTKWADELRLGITFFNINKEEQHSALMTTAFGEVTSTQTSIFPTLRYKKSLFNNKLNIDQFAVYNKITSTRIDTCNCSYDWFGNKTVSSSKNGEVDADGSLSKLHFTNFTSRTHLSYELNNTNFVELNNVFSSFSRIGSDPFGNKYLYSGRDILSVRAGFDKLITSIGLESKIFKKRLTNSLIFKYYQYKTNGTDASFASADENQISHQGKRYGFAEAVKYAFSDNTFVRISAELATRLPEQGEMFGDGLFAMSNFKLNPEKSTNINLGFKTLFNKRKITLDVNSFYRFAKDLIIQVPYQMLFLQYQNVDNVKGYGLEIESQYQVQKWLSVTGNITYQDLRLYDIEDFSTLFLENARVRNTPFLFGNLNVKTNFKNIVKTHDNFQAYWYYNFVHQYYLETIPQNKEADGFLGLGKNDNISSEFIIPTQNIHTVGFNYGLWSQKISVGVEIKNVLDAKLYDNFRVQRAGRSIHFKIRYIIK
jgi:outer membrane cobalamin receptor